MKRWIIIGIIAIIIISLISGIYFLFFYDIEKDPSVKTCLNSIKERLLFEEKISIAPSLEMKVKEYKKFESKEKALGFIEENSFEINLGYPKVIQELKTNNFSTPIIVVVISSTFKTNLEALCSLVSPEECAEMQKIVNEVYIFPTICVRDTLVNTSLEDIKWSAGRTFEYDSETNERVYILDGKEKRFKIE